MRLWSLHPQYLDTRGLVALWREGLLARAVLRGDTTGYRHHPQLERFREHQSPLTAIDAYLLAIYDEATARGYAFDRAKVGPFIAVQPIVVPRGQLDYEWAHLLRKLRLRSPAWYRQLRGLRAPKCHPLFQCRAGGIAAWERRDESE